jgi:hypothetical protein
MRPADRAGRRGRASGSSFHSLASGNRKVVGRGILSLLQDSKSNGLRFGAKLLCAEPAEPHTWAAGVIAGGGF